MSLSGKKHSLNSWMFIPAFREEGKDIGFVFRKLPEAGVGWAMGPSDTCTKYVIQEGHRLKTFRKGSKRASGRQHRAEEAPGLGGETLGLVSASDLTEVSSSVECTPPLQDGGEN